MTEEDFLQHYLPQTMENANKIINGLREKLKKTEKFIKKVSEHGSCDAYIESFAGQKFKGCKIYNNKNSDEYCLRCEALNLLVGKYILKAVCRRGGCSNIDYIKHDGFCSEECRMTHIF